MPPSCLPLLKEFALGDIAALLTHILENPADDTARLVLADVLRETEDTGERFRGRFLWGGVTTSRYASGSTIADDICRIASLEMVAVLELGHPARWFSQLGLGPRPLISQDWRFSTSPGRYTVHIGGYEGVFCRGMLSEMSIPLGEWYELGEAALAKWPLERIRITDVSELVFTIRKSGNEWELEAGFVLQERGTDPAGSGPGIWIRRSYPDRQSLKVHIARESGDLVNRLNDLVEDR